MPDPLPYPRLAAALALACVLIGRGLSRALPGSAAGIGEAIDRISLLGAALTQFGAMVLMTLAIRSATLILVGKFAAPGFKVLSTVGTAFIAATTLFAALLAHNQLALFWSVALAVIVTSILGVSALTMLRTAEKRAVSLVALGIALTALVHTLARILALVAAEQASVLGFSFARGLATFGFGLELVCLAAAGAWLLAPPTPVPRAVGAVLVAIGPALALAASRDEGWGLVLGRTLEHLTAHPDPALPLIVRFTVELWGFAAVILCLVTRSRKSGLLGVLGLTLLGRASADVPLGAVFLLNGALALQLLPNPAGSDEPQGAAL